MTTALLIIDPQIDFCDPHGALYVPGAEKDMHRLAQMILRRRARIDAIYVTLDSHHYVHIANPIFWQDPIGNHPPPFTNISQEDVETGHWRATDPQWQQHARDYVRQLDLNGRYQLTIWPPHCLIGSGGQAVAPELFQALLAWETQYRVVEYFHKGSNPLTEHYSAVKADVLLPDDPQTHLNTKLIQALSQAGTIAIAGEARTHCVANTVRDIADHFETPEDVAKLVLLTDATSDIGGFEKFAADFLEDLTGRGMRLHTTETFLG